MWGRMARKQLAAAAEFRLSALTAEGLRRAQAGQRSGAAAVQPQPARDRPGAVLVRVFSLPELRRIPAATVQGMPEAAAAELVQQVVAWPRVEPFPPGAARDCRRLPSSPTAAMRPAPC